MVQYSLKLYKKNHNKVRYYSVFRLNIDLDTRIIRYCFDIVANLLLQNDSIILKTKTQNKIFSRPQNYASSRRFTIIPNIMDITTRNKDYYWSKILKINRNIFERLILQKYNKKQVDSLRIQTTQQNLLV